MQSRRNVEKKKYKEVCESLNKNGLGFVDWEHADSEEQPLYSLDFDQCFSWLSLPEGKEPWDFIMHRALASLLMHYGKDEDICRFIKCTLGQHENCARIEYYATAFSKKIDDYSTLLKNVKKLMPKTHGILEDYKKKSFVSIVHHVADFAKECTKLKIMHNDMWTKNIIVKK